MTGRRARRLAAAVAIWTLAASGSLLVEGAACQMISLDPLPWRETDSPTVPRALEIAFARAHDEKTHWLSHTVGVLGLASAGERSFLFVRVQYISLDTAGRAAVDRWPFLRGEEAPEGWPLESRSVGFGSPEIGALSDVGVLGAGRWRFGASIALPIGRDVLYPFASTSLPVRLELRKAVPLTDGWAASVGGGRTTIIDSARDDLASEAFPATTQLNLGFGRAWATEREIAGGWRGEWGSGLVSSRIHLCWRLPARAGGAMTITVERELAAAATRSFGTRLSVALMLPGVAPAPDGAGSRVAK